MIGSRMATLHVPSGLIEFTGGVATVELDAARVSDALDELARKYPSLAPHLADMAVAVDGEIYTQPGYQPLSTSSEIHLLPRIAGG
jgi:molybdopterin converting factor small subunit